MTIARDDLRAAAERHLVAFYETDGYLLDAVVTFFCEALAEGDSAVLVATHQHRRLFITALRAKGIDVDGAMADRRLVILDAAATLATFMEHGMPSREVFRDVVGAIVRDAAGPGRRVRVYGEMVAVLWAEEMCEAAILLEDLWNELAGDHPFSLLCAYPMKAFDGGSTDDFLSVCHQHAAVLPLDPRAGSDERDAERLQILRAGAAPAAEPAGSLKAEVIEDVRARVVTRGQLMLAQVRRTIEAIDPLAGGDNPAVALAD